MLQIPTSTRVALLIDADNIPLNRLKEILKLVANYGQLKICRAYGDWKKPQLSPYRDTVRKLNIKPVQVDRVEKNATDKRLIIEADKIMRKNTPDLFIIVSGDGDFRQLCERIKERGRKVVGIGNKGQTSPHLREACDDFYYIEDLEETLEQAPLAFLRKAYIQIQRPNGMAHIGQLGQILRKLDPGFESHFGKRKLSKWLDDYPTIFKRDDNYVTLAQ